LPKAIANVEQKKNSTPAFQALSLVNSEENFRQRQEFIPAFHQILK